MIGSNMLHDAYGPLSSPVNPLRSKDLNTLLCNPDRFLQTMARTFVRNIEYYSHIWAGAAEFSLSNLDRVQKLHRVIVGDKLFSTPQYLSYRRVVACLTQLYLYFLGKGSGELHSLVLLGLNFAYIVSPIFPSYCIGEG